MTKNERIHLINIAARLETVIECLNESLITFDAKDRVKLVKRQINALNNIIGDILKGGEVSE